MPPEKSLKVFATRSSFSLLDQTQTIGSAEQSPILVRQEIHFVKKAEGLGKCPQYLTLLASQALRRSHGLQPGFDAGGDGQERRFLKKLQERNRDPKGFADADVDSDGTQGINANFS